MLDSWLRQEEVLPSPYSQFRLMNIDEATTLSPEIRSHLINVLRDARFNPSFLETLDSAAEDTGWHEVKELIISQGMPTWVAAKRGDFGEVLITAILEETLGYVIPVAKLRYKITGNQLLTGTDSLALKLNPEGAIIEVCFVESKLRTAIKKEEDRMIAVQGCQQLQKDYESKLPDILSFIAQRLWDTKSELFEPFMNYMRYRQDTTDIDTFRLSLCWDQEEWNEQVLGNLEEHEVGVPQLIVHKICIKELGPMTDDLFAAIGVLEVSDDD